MRENKTEKLILTAADVAAALGITPGRVYQMIRAKELPSARVGKRGVRIPRAAFEAHLRQMNAEALASVQPAPKTVSLAGVLAHYSPPGESEAVPTPETAPEAAETGLAALLSLVRSPLLAELLAGFEEAEKAQAAGWETWLRNSSLPLRIG